MTRVPRPGLSVPILIAVGDVDLEVTIVDISTMAGRLSFFGRRNRSCSRTTDVDARGVRDERKRAEIQRSPDMGR